MTEYPPLVGRADELATIRTAVHACGHGANAPILVSGEAGIGKSHLIAAGLEGWTGLVLRATHHPGDGIYPAFRRILEICQRSIGPEVVDPATAVLLDRAEPLTAISESDTIAEGLAATLRHVAEHGPTVIVVEDLHWASTATIDLLPRIVPALLGTPVLVILTYRSDELARSHPVRAMRADLRRTTSPTELALGPLSEPETTEVMAALLEATPAPGLARSVYQRSAGLPLFVRELSIALADGGGLTNTSDGIDLATGAGVPVPESIVDAVLVRTRDLLETVGEAVELAAVLGVSVDLDVLTQLVPPEQVDDLLESSLLIERETGAEFRHALVRDALYRIIPWSRRRAHHRRVAETMEAGESPPETVAHHWLCASDHARARPCLLAAAERFCTLGAYRDAADAVRRALDGWPTNDHDDDRTDALERLADCAEMCGELTEAADTWDEVAERRRAGGDLARMAVATRRLANAADMLGDRERATRAREAAAAAFVAANRADEAASEFLVLAEQLEAAAQPGRALAHAEAAVSHARVAERADLEAHALSLQGVVVAALGDVETGLAISRSGVELALDNELVEATGSGYYDLATTLIYASDYEASTDTWGRGVDFCRAHGLADQGAGCLACMAVAVRFLGDWNRAVEIARKVLTTDPPPPVQMVAQEEVALIHALRGTRRGVKSRLREAQEFGHRAGIFGIEVGALWGAAALADANDDSAEALSRTRLLIDRCEDKEPSHFALPALRWASSCLGAMGSGDELARCHRLVARYATENSSPQVLSVLAHAGGEVSLGEGDAERAIGQFRRSLDLIRDRAFPMDTAVAQLRLAVALDGVDERQAAVAAITGAYRTARQLGAKPTARRCAEALDAMGENVDRRLGRLAARALEPAGLTRREQQVLGLVARGDTNRDIAGELFVSVRTVDMHVRNVLSKLDCTSRAAAARRAVELGLVNADTETVPEP